MTAVAHDKGREQMQQVVYVASPASQQIHVFALAGSGELALLQVVDTPGQVQPLVISPDGHWLHAAVRPDFALISYRIGVDGRLSEPSSAPLAGSASHRHLGRQYFLLAASYAFNHVTVSAIRSSGRAAPPHQQLDGLQAAHSVTLLAADGQGEQEVLVACLKEDRIRRFVLCREGRLRPIRWGSADRQRRRPAPSGAAPKQWRPLLPERARLHHQSLPAQRRRRNHTVPEPGDAARRLSGEYWGRICTSRRMGAFSTAASGPAAC